MLKSNPQQVMGNSLVAFFSKKESKTRTFLFAEHALVILNGVFEHGL